MSLREVMSLLSEVMHALRGYWLLHSGNLREAHTSPLAYRLFSSLIVYLLVAVVAPRNLLDLYLRCIQSLIRVVAVKIQCTSIAIRGPHELRERVGRGETAATSTSRASSLLQARFDEGAVVIHFGEPYNLACK